MSGTRSRLDHGRYTDPLGFEAECRELVQRCWLYLGLAGEFGTTPTAVEIGGGVVLVTRDGDRIRARLDAAEGRVACLGHLVFAHFGAEPPPLESAVAPYQASLQAIGERLVSIEHRERTLVAANWKLVIENTLEDYHVPEVHAGTFLPPLDAWRQHMRYERPGGPDGQPAPTVQLWDLRPDPVAGWARIDRRVRLDRHGDYPGYRHLYLFPWLYLSTVYSGFVVLHRVIPQAVDRSVIEWTLCLPLAAPVTPARAAIRAGIVSTLADGARAVINEDVGLCALAQKGRHFAVHRPLYGAREARLIDYERQVLGD